MAKEFREKFYEAYFWWFEGYACKGINKNFKCLFSIHDLPYLMQFNNFVADGFSLEYDPIAYQCMEEYVFQKEKIVPHLAMSMFNYCKYLKLFSYISNCP